MALTLAASKNQVRSLTSTHSKGYNVLSSLQYIVHIRLKATKKKSYLVYMNY
jgi:hypothetical protein